MKYSESQSVTELPLAVGYSLQYNIFNDTYFCLATGQTLNDRVVTLKGHAYKPEEARPANSINASVNTTKQTVKPNNSLIEKSMSMSSNKNVLKSSLIHKVEELKVDLNRQNSSQEDSYVREPGISLWEA